MNKISNCKICKKPLIGKQTMYCSARCKNQQHQSYSAQKERGLQRKIDLFKIAGGKCTKCGYKKNLSSLSFHHLEPKTKEFKLDVRSLSNRTINSIMKEFRKCILLCHNCHAEVHNPELELDRLSLSRLL